MKNITAFYLVVLSCSLLTSACGTQCMSQTRASDVQQLEAKTKKLSIVNKLKENAHLPVAERIALYNKLKKEHAALYDFENETELTLYGYSFLYENNLVDALAIFELIIVQFPNSANAYDSKGEAYLAAKDSANALKYYSKSLEMDPDNFHAEDVIESIQYPNIKPLTAKEKFSKIYSKEEYQSDLNQLGQKLLTVHPHPLKFISKEQFWKNIETQKSLITDNTTYAEFAWHCNAIIASIGCSHTASSDMQNVYHEFGIVPLEKTFPLQVRLIDDKLFVVNPMTNTQTIKVKDEIVGINGVETPKLISAIFQHISSQANSQTNKRQKFNKYFALMIPYALGLPKSFDVQLKGRNETIKLNQAESFAAALYDPVAINCPDNLCFEIIDKNTALMTIASFNYYDWDNRHLIFYEFIDKHMQELREKKIKNLIIDVRYNGGGSQHPSIYLLQHLLDKSFVYYSKAEYKGKTEPIYGEGILHPHANRFKGKVYFLIDGNGNSTTGHFMSLVKSLKLGTIIGEELGSNQFCTAGQTLCRLKNTKLVVSVANNTHISSATSLPDDIGIRPDFYVSQTVDEYLNKVDAVKEFTLKLIKK